MEGHSMFLKRQHILPALIGMVLVFSFALAVFPVVCPGVCSTFQVDHKVDCTYSSSPLVEGKFDATILFLLPLLGLLLFPVSLPPPDDFLQPPERPPRQALFFSR